MATRILRDQLGERLAAQAGADFSAPIVEREHTADTTPTLPRHPEVRAKRASKGDGPENPGRSSFEGRLRRPPQDDGERQSRGEGRPQPPRRDDRERKPPRRSRRPHRGRHSGPRPSRPKER